MIRGKLLAEMLALALGHAAVAAAQVAVCPESGREWLDRLGLIEENIQVPPEDYSCDVTEEWWYVLALPGHETTKDFGLDMFVSKDGFADCSFGPGFERWTFSVGQRPADESESRRIAQDIVTRWGLSAEKLRDFGKTYRFLFVPKAKRMERKGDLNETFAVHQVYFIDNGLFIVHCTFQEKSWPATHSSRLFWQLAPPEGS